MRDRRLLVDARIARDVADVLVSGEFIGRSLVEVVRSLDKVIAYLESESE